MSARSRFIPDARPSEDKRHASFIPRSRDRRSLLHPLRSFRRKRLILVIVAIWLLYLFFKHMPTNVPTAAQRYDARFGGLHPFRAGAQHSLQQDAGAKVAGEGYNGPIKFRELGKSLHYNPLLYPALGNVMFVVSRMDSIARLLPVACSMAQQNRTVVQLAFMGRDMPAWDKVLSLNGIAQEDCKLYVHDARPDFAVQSSPARLAIAAQASLDHVHSASPLSAVLIGNGEFEDNWLMKAISDKSHLLGLSVITIPSGGVAGISWLSSLDSSSLAYFGHVQIDIVIHVQPESATSVIRLLRSIQAADYSGWNKPRIILELPPSPDSFLMKYLSGFKWPSEGPSGGSNLILRHRVNTSPLKPARAATWVVESFYPSISVASHVLILSPEVELSRGYYHYVMYTLLEYRYGSQHPDLMETAIGIALHLPDQTPDQKATAPWRAAGQTHAMTLWQVPDSKAAIYLGERWVELHYFVGQRLEKDAEMSKRIKDSEVMSPENPAWVQTMMEMMKARNYYMLYPSFIAKGDTAIATIHGDLQRPPEESQTIDEVEQEVNPTVGGQDSGTGTVLTADNEVQRLLRQEHPGSSESFVTSLLEAVSSGSGDQSFPLFTFAGESVALSEGLERSWSFAEEFSRSIGGCKGFDRPSMGAATLDSLFCDSDR
ncbi:hypothetical protein B0A52_05361 [Exophiala mesophila]|uniref:Uncharacterized protein n=1 Tax=Exophiala mesophila TaxID=212818 RepID=A0A438N512_EXOME|nr:hypothetical protein B0A52_05361 [Exophiala mesophila]